MPNIRRSTYVFFYFQDGSFIDIRVLLKGLAELTRVKQIYAISVLCREVYPITMEDLLVLHEIPSDEWIPLSRIIEKYPKLGSQAIKHFAHRGLILSDEDDSKLAELRQQHEKLASSQWNIFAAFYHFMTKWEDMHLRIKLPDDSETLGEINTENFNVMEKFVELYGKPPTHFHSEPNRLSTHELPIIKRDHPLYKLLLQRRTTRAYDRSQPMTLEQLAIILYYVYGCHGYSRIFEDIIGLKRTSPSGGGLHPVGVYTLVINVDGLEAGLYHYSMQNHSLEMIELLERKEAEDLANEFTSGQSFPKQAHVLFIMTARFYRNFWKYRKHPKAYTVINMDAAHLSQTLYLVCAELGLGAFVTAAINSINIERRLGLNGFDEGAIVICGCGIPLSGVSNPDPEFLPYIPRLTAL